MGEYFHQVVNRVRNFAADRRGNYAAIFAMISTVLLLAGSLALDTARMYSTHTKMTQAIDAAVLATTQGLTQGDIPLEDAEQKVLDYINANLDGRNLNSGDITIDKITVDPAEKSVQVEAHTMMPMTMGGLVGYSEQRVATLSKAKFANTNVEVVMALDITGSMGDKIGGYGTPTKLEALKTAAGLGIDTLLGTAGGSDRIRIGLVPYSEAVNARPVIDNIETTGTQGAWKWDWDTWRLVWVKNPCVHERTGPEKYSDAFANSTAKVGGSNKTCPSAEIVALSNNSGMLKTKINAFTDGGNTAGHIAIAWAYYMLSPKWNSVWPADSQVGEYNAAGVSKYAIIMTDGEFNTFESGGGGASSSRTYAQELCSSMKTSGIKIYSIAFAAGGSAETLMQNCASSNDGKKLYFNATDETSLTDAFVAIAQDIQGLRLIN